MPAHRREAEVDPFLFLKLKIPLHIAPFLFSRAARLNKPPKTYDRQSFTAAVVLFVSVAPHDTCFSASPALRAQHSRTPNKLSTSM